MRYRSEPFPLLLILSAFFCLTAVLMAPQALAGDWPTYRHDNTRSGATAEKVQTPLALEWTYLPMHPPKPAWPWPAEEAPRSHADNAYHVTVGGGCAYFGSSVDNKIHAVDIEEAAVRWTFYSHGPIRFAPTYALGRLYFGSDDGYVYCLDGSKGELLWKYRPGPGEDKALGNGRMISVWPVRTSILVDRGQVLFCAGVFPFEGLYVCCLDADTGAEIWKNDTVADRAHDLPYGGISPQSYLLASEEMLFVPSGRAMPAAFDRRTGEFLFYAAPGAKRGGTWALLDGDRLLAGVDLSGTPEKVSYSTKTGGDRKAVYAWFPGLDMVVTERVSYILTKEGIYAIDRAAYAAAKDRVDAASKMRKELNSRLSQLRKEREKAEGSRLEEIDDEMELVATDLLDLEAGVKMAKASSYRWKYEQEGLCTLILAKDVVFTGGKDFVKAVDALTGQECWSAPVKGSACGFAAADGRLFVSTDKGPIHCFGPRKEGTAKDLITYYNLNPYPEDELTEIYASAATRIVEEGKINRGYGLVLNCGNGRLAMELAVRTGLKIIGLEEDPDLLTEARRKLESAGLWGTRVVVEPWDIDDLPPYFANLVVSDAMVRTGKPELPFDGIQRVLRPSGGTLVTCGPGAPGERTWSKFVKNDLQGGGAWTHLYGNPGNTACSNDQHVKGPFGILWYGEPGPQQIVDRHGRACSPVSMKGRVFHQGEEVVMAYDAYNGSFLWKREIPGAVRVRVDVDGGNLALAGDGLYVAAHDQCLRLDPATGRTLNTYKVPPRPDGSPCRWGYVAVEDGLVYGTRAEPLNMEYGAAWKDFVEAGEDRWLNEEEVEESTWQRWNESGGYASVYGENKGQYPEAGESLYQQFHRSGTLWHPMADFPSWGSERTPKGARTSRIMAGDAVFAFETDTGKMRWIHEGKDIPNITIAIGKETIYFVEDAPAEEDRDAAVEEVKTLTERGVYEEGAEARHLKAEDRDVRIVTALDAATGEKRWRRPMDLSGCGGDKMGAACDQGVLLFFGHFSNHDTGFFLNNELTWRRVTALDTGTGRVLWSRPLNYLRRPLIVGDTVIIEPRACDLRTGRIKMREHPITGQPVPWEFLRPGHCCSVTSASAHTLFYRSYFAAIYDLTGDRGLNLFGAIRPGCWLNMITAGGLMVMPEASSGCTCSFPIRCTVALANKPEKVSTNWSVFITHGPNQPVKHLAVNLGAPGDMRDRDGTMWLAWPRPRTVSPIGYPAYAMKLDLKHELTEGKGYFKQDYKGVEIKGSNKPWLFTSGCEGRLRLEVPLFDNDLVKRSQAYTVRLGFTAPPSDRPGSRVFAVRLQGAPVLEDYDIVKAAGGGRCAVVEEIKGVQASGSLVLELDGEKALLNYVEILREGGGPGPGALPGTGTKPGAGAPTGTGTPASSGEMVGGGRIPGPEDILEMADAMRLATGDKYGDSLVEHYHAVLFSDGPAEVRVKALDRMAELANPASIPAVKRCWQSSRSILSGYKPEDPEVLAGTVKVCFAVSDRLAEEDKARALEAVEEAAAVLPDLTDPDLSEAVLARLGYIASWRILGPVSWGEGEDSVQAVHAAGKPMDPGFPLEVVGGTLEWLSYRAERPMIDLEEVLGAHDHVSAYAYAEIDLDGAREVQLKIGSDDGFNCWFNEEHVGGFDAPRSWLKDDSTITVKGKKGRNTLMMQVIDAGGSWAFSVRVLDREGYPLGG